MKKRIKLLLCIALISSALCFFGCGGGDVPTDYPVMEAIDSSAVQTETANGVGVSANYDPNVWTFDGSGASGNYTLYYNVDDNPNGLMNINHAYPDEVANGTSYEKFMGMLENTYTSVLGAEIVKAEVCMLEGKEIITIEMVSKMTDKMIDLLLEQGTLTEEMIVNYGGREALLEIPPTMQISMTQFVDGQAYTFVGSYYDESQKQICLDGLKLVMQTLHTTN